MQSCNHIFLVISGLLICASLVFADEGEKPSPEASEPPVADREVAGAPLLISEVLKRRDELIGKKIEIVACLLTHFEGPWICLHPDAPFENAISLELPEECVLTAKDGKKKLDWFENDQGYCSVISGTLRMREKRSPDDPEVRLYVDVTSGRELAVDDPLWRKYILQFKQEGEQGGAGEPATRSESDLEGSDKPQSEAEGRSR